MGEQEKIMQKRKGDKTMMTLIRLQEVLGHRIEVTLREGMTTEERMIENEQTVLILEAAKQMINNGDLILRTEKLAAQNKALEKSVAMQLIKG